MTNYTFNYFDWHTFEYTQPSIYSTLVYDISEIEAHLLYLGIDQSRMPINVECESIFSMWTTVLRYYTLWMFQLLGKYPENIFSSKRLGPLAF